jgi:hypothetical protein
VTLSRRDLLRAPTTSEVSGRASGAQFEAQTAAYNDSGLADAERAQASAESGADTARFEAQSKAQDMDPRNRVEEARSDATGSVAGAESEARYRTSEAVTIDQPREVEETRSTIDMDRMKADEIQNDPAKLGGDQVVATRDTAVEATRDVRDPTGAAQRATTAAIDSAASESITEDRATLDVDVKTPTPPKKP